MNGFYKETQRPIRKMFRIIRELSYTCKLNVKVKLHFCVPTTAGTFIVKMPVRMATKSVKQLKIN